MPPRERFDALHVIRQIALMQAGFSVFLVISTVIWALIFGQPFTRDLIASARPFAPDSLQRPCVVAAYLTTSAFVYAPFLSLSAIVTVLSSP